eukprot:8787023-Pyramimonas_sp.AAC.1
MSMLSPTGFFTSNCGPWTCRTPPATPPGRPPPPPPSRPRSSPCNDKFTKGEANSPTERCVHRRRGASKYPAYTRSAGQSHEGRGDILGARANRARGRGGWSGCLQASTIGPSRPAWGHSHTTHPEEQGKLLPKGKRRLYRRSGAFTEGAAREFSRKRRASFQRVCYGCCGCLPDGGVDGGGAYHVILVETWCTWCWFLENTKSCGLAMIMLPM